MENKNCSWGKIVKDNGETVTVFCQSKMVEVNKSLIEWDLRNQLKKTPMVFNSAYRIGKSHLKEVA